MSDPDPYEGFHPDTRALAEKIATTLTPIVMGQQLGAVREALALATVSLISALVQYGAADHEKQKMAAVLFDDFAAEVGAIASQARERWCGPRH